MGDERDIVEIIRPHRLTPNHACVGITAVHLRSAASTIESLRAENERLREALKVFIGDEKPITLWLTDKPQS